MAGEYVALRHFKVGRKNVGPGDPIDAEDVPNARTLIGLNMLGLASGEQAALDDDPIAPRGGLGGTPLEVANLPMSRTREEIAAAGDDPHAIYSGYALDNARKLVRDSEQARLEARGAGVSAVQAWDDDRELRRARLGQAPLKTDDPDDPEQPMAHDVDLAADSLSKGEDATDAPPVTKAGDGKSDEPPAPNTTKDDVMIDSDVDPDNPKEPTGALTGQEVANPDPTQAETGETATAASERGGPRTPAAPSQGTRTGGDNQTPTRKGGSSRTGKA